LVDSTEILKFIEFSGGVSPFWLPRTTPVGQIKLQSISNSDKTYKTLIVIGLVIAIIVLTALLIYRYDKKKDQKRFEEKIKEAELKKQKPKQPEPEEMSQN